MCIARFILDCNQFGNYRNNFISVTNIKFHVKWVTGSLVDTFRWTDGRTVGYLKPNSRICDFAEAPVNRTSFILQFPSFHALSASMFKLIQNFLPPVTRSGKFPHSSAG
jgi:hypothetical protein